ncbi:hypothetical protein O3M35_003589 [Rhynocoris fuscipes]|uniref:Uncharacterized protein n=1 Tax=Rhynocoris fuscipes TaxID=488301 RepID=A0AAW1CKV6_9HEMI
MRNIIYLTVFLQLIYIGLNVLCYETMTEEPVTSPPELEDSFLNISSTLKNIRQKIGVISKYLPKAFPTNTSEVLGNEPIDEDLSRYNGTYEGIMEKIDRIKNKVKEIKDTLQNINKVLDNDLN